MTQSAAIKQTINWIEQTVVALNFCPFARPVLQQQSAHYLDSDADDAKSAAEACLELCERLQAATELETAFVIFTKGFGNFAEYLDALHYAELSLQAAGFDAVYQIASFHPQYQFADSEAEDPANYTNRSPYPMFHLLREDLLAEAIARHPDTEAIPERNIARARALGNEDLARRLAAATAKN